MSKRTTRAVCDVCGAELPPRPPGQRGRPQQYCDRKTTGRPCREWNKRYDQVRKLGDQIVANSPSATRGKARYRIRAELATARDELAGGKAR